MLQAYGLLGEHLFRVGGELDLVRSGIDLPAVGGDVIVGESVLRQMDRDGLRLAL